MRKHVRARNRATLGLLLCVSAFPLGPRAQGQSAHPPQYLITDIGVLPRLLPGHVLSNAVGINESGVVVGISAGRAIVYRDGVLQDLGTLGGATSDAAAINDAGAVVGNSDTATVRSRAFLYADGTMTPLGEPDDFFAWPRAVNARRQIVGAWTPPIRDTTGHTHAFLYEKGTFTDLGPLPGSTSDFSWADDINAHGQIVGASGGPSGYLLAVTWENGTARILECGDSGVAARAINDSGVIVGDRSVGVGADRRPRAVIWDANGRCVELPAPPSGRSRPVDINSAGDIVGEFSPAACCTDPRAALWRGGVLYDLNDLIPAGSGWQLMRAEAINDAGQIVGRGFNPSGELRGFVLTPSGGAAWNSHDIGKTGITGSLAVGPDGLFTVRGAGHDIWDTSDVFHFVHQPLSGDGSIVTRVDSITDTNPYAKAGVMMRESLSPDAAHVILNVKPNLEVEFMQRPAANGETQYLGGTFVSPSSWLRLTRRGATIVAAVSPDGVSWTDVGETPGAMGDRIEAGLAVTSHDPSLLNTARFSGSSLMRAPWMNRDVGSVGVTGRASFNDDTLTVSGAGSNIWDAADSFHYVSQPLATDGEITARVRQVEQTHTKAKAGVMIREGLSPDAAHVILSVKPDGDVEFMQRATRGGPTTYLGGGTGSWVRLARRGSSVIASISADGTSWTELGSTTTAFTNDVTVGVAVTSHHPGRLNATVVDNISVR